MRTDKSLRNHRVEAAPETDFDDDHSTYEVFRLDCPECGQSIALLADEEALPQHALCPTPWNPFGLTVCGGSGLPASEAAPTAGTRGTQEEGAAALLSLPAGLDWRRQPFSHAGGPGSRPARTAVAAGRG
ncbi:hypothetical protein [Streptomyces sp. TR06-5]|uniref:hypothetical protein n=1 Tax=unclassified Streptomyces TaxID=2593676 RepID=UPI0039A12C7E